METLKERLEDYFDHKVSTEELIMLYNDYTEAVGYNNKIYDNNKETVNEFFSTPWDFAESLLDGYSSYHSHVKFDDHGCVESTSYPEFWIDKNEMIQYIVENDDDLEDKNIRQILNEH